MLALLAHVIGYDGRAKHKIETQHLHHQCGNYKLEQRVSVHRMHQAIIMYVLFNYLLISSAAMAESVTKLKSSIHISGARMTIRANLGACTAAWPGNAPNSS
jgi:hypothetical protein